MCYVSVFKHQQKKIKQKALACFCFSPERTLGRAQTGYNLFDLALGGLVGARGLRRSLRSSAWSLPALAAGVEGGVEELKSFLLFLSSQRVGLRSVGSQGWLTCGLPGPLLFLPGGLTCGWWAARWGWQTSYIPIHQGFFLIHLSPPLPSIGVSPSPLSASPTAPCEIKWNRESAGCGEGAKSGV